MNREPTEQREWPPRRCPVCDALPFTALYRQRFQAISGAALFSGYNVCVCGKCGLGYADDIPGQDAFEAYYRDLSKYENPNRDGHESTYDTTAYETTADLICHLVPARSSRIVDVGCATGGLLAAFKRRGFSNLVGIDPSPACAAIAHRLHGIRVFTGTLSNLPAMGVPAEFVMLTGVLEHVRELQPLLKMVRAVMTSVGRIHVAVPDATKFIDWPNAPFQHFSLEHVNFFTPLSLANLMKSVGFREVFIRQVGREQGFATFEPVIHATFERDDGGERSWTFDNQTEPALRAYVQQSRRAQEEEEIVINQLVASREPILVWGVGTLTQRLLASTNLPQANIRAFVDSNPHYQGKQLIGRPILAPAELQSRPEAILISSWMYQKEIEEQIRNVLGLRNRVIKLHDV